MPKDGAVDAQKASIFPVPRVFATLATHAEQKVNFHSMRSVSKMALIMSVLSVAFSVLLTPFLMLLLAIIFLASIGKSLGIRKFYIKLLLTLFEVRLSNVFF